MDIEKEHEELLPCPFCGGKVILCGNEHTTMRMIHVLCLDCETSGGSHKFHKEAALAWNRRAALQSQDREDAERYRWLRDKSRVFKQDPDMSGNHYWMVRINGALRGATIDEAIDHASRVEGMEISVNKFNET